jgi:hypothetical protein
MSQIKKFADCAACSDLWSEYGEATQSHFRLEGKLQIAGLSHEYESVKEMMPKVQAAAEARTAIRARIQKHLMEAHGIALIE